MVRKDKSPHRSSIRTRLNLLVIGVVTLSVLPAAGLVAGDAIQSESQARWAAATGAAELLAGNAVDAAQARNAAEATAVLRAATQIPGVAYARLDLPSGQMLAEAGTGSRLPTDIELEAGAPRAHITGLAFHDVVRVTAKVRQGPNTLGDITIVHTAGPFAPDLLRALAGILVLGACALAGGLYLARRMQNAMTCPIGELTQSMDAARRFGDLSQTVVTHSHDEIGTLVDSYNLMLEALVRRKLDGVASAEAEDRPQTAAETPAEMPQETVPDEVQAVDIAPLPEVVAETVSEAVPEIAPEIEPQIVTESVSDIIPPAEADDVRDIDILDFADDLVARFGAAAHAKGLELVTFADPAAPRQAPGNAARLGEVVAALIDNALKFTEAGHISLEIAADPKPDFWRLVVNDTGIGIPRPQLKSILKVGETQGSLPAARQVVETMGGAMAVTSDSNGSQFHIRLPALPDVQTAAPPRADGCTAALCLSATAERDALAARFTAAGVTITDDADRADLVLADLAARQDLNVPADRLVLLNGPEGDDQAWVAQGKAWAGLRRPLRYGDIDALIEVMARDATSRDTLAQVVEDLAAEDIADEIDIITAEPEPALDLYPKQAPEALAQIVAAFQARDTDAMAAAAHRLISLSQTIGARPVAEAAEAIAQTLRDGRPVTIDEVARLHARLERTLAALAEVGVPETHEALVG